MIKICKKIKKTLPEAAARFKFLAVEFRTS